MLNIACKKLREKEFNFKVDGKTFHCSIQIDGVYFSQNIIKYSYRVKYLENTLLTDFFDGKNETAICHGWFDEVQQQIEEDVEYALAILV